MAGIATIAGVATHVSGFVRNSPNGPQDADIQKWIDTRWEEIQAIVVRRGLPVPVSGDGFNTLELINRIGAAADLAATLSTRFATGSRWQVEKNLRDDFMRMLARLDNGEYDKQLNPTSRTVNPGAQMQAIGGQEQDPLPDPDRNVAFQRNEKF